MSMHKGTICVIPARLDSTRFPRKMVASLGGKPLLQRVYEAAVATGYFERVIAAVDSEELASLVLGFGGEVVQTAISCQSGTERLIELVQKGEIEAGIWVNWQGDEPFIHREMIEQLLQSTNRQEEEIWTLKAPIQSIEELASAHVVKVVCDRTGRALYFSRSCIPYGGTCATTFRHVGLYAYRKEALKKLASLSPAPWEEEERLEQLRFIFHQMHIRVHETGIIPHGIDTPNDLILAEAQMETFLNRNVSTSNPIS